MTLSKADIAKVIDEAKGAGPTTKRVPVPELGGTVVVREMSGSLRNAFEATIAQVQSGADSKALDRLMLRIAKECVLDADGDRLLDDRSAQLVFNTTPRALFRIRDEVVQLSALSESDFEALVEGFSGDPSEDSTSD